MAKKKERPIPKPLCSLCHKTIDAKEAAQASREGRWYVHECGRVLVRGKP